MPFCQECGTKNQETSLFCANCGTKIDADVDDSPAKEVSGVSSSNSSSKGEGSPISSSSPEPPQYTQPTKDKQQQQQSIDRYKSPDTSKQSGSICQECGTKNEATDIFCANCGTRLSVGKNQQQQSQGYKSPATGQQSTSKPNYSESGQQSAQPQISAGAEKKDSSLMFAISIIIPGFAFFVIEEYPKGVGFFLGTVILVSLGGILFLFGLIVYGVQLYYGKKAVDEYNKKIDIRERNQQNTQNGP